MQERKLHGICMISERASERTHEYWTLNTCAGFNLRVHPFDSSMHGMLLAVLVVAEAEMRVSGSSQASVRGCHFNMYTTESPFTSSLLGPPFSCTPVESGFEKTILSVSSSSIHRRLIGLFI